MENYRFGVVGVFRNEINELLFCERSNLRGIWQFPQGGLDDGETPREALLREMSEELGTSSFKILKESSQWSQYDFPENADFALAKEFIGQQHMWFLCQFNAGAEPDLTKSDGEFSAWMWQPLDPSLKSIVDWKRTAYRQGLEMLGVL